MVMELLQLMHFLVYDLGSLYNHGKLISSQCNMIYEHMIFYFLKFLR